MRQVLDPMEYGTRLPIKVWEPEGKAVQGDFDVFQQFRNLANHPLSVMWVCGMPDYHLGYGMPIGGVLATEGGVVPNAVGVDIGCGMIAVQTDVPADNLDRPTLEAIRQEIHRRVPVGQSHHKEGRALPQRLSGADAKLTIVAEQRDAAQYQLGTLGGGNHFIELQRDDKRGSLWIMLHSGSRNVGKRVCDFYNAAANKYMSMFKTDVGKDLAFLPQGMPEYEAYIAEMRWCMAFAEESREEMMRQVFAAFEAVTNREPLISLKVDTHHNFAALERHYGRNVWVHRKGAVKAEGLVTIPGSMGTASYIAEGLRPLESFNTCSHGAGRVMGRAEANRQYADRHDEAVEMMQHVVYGVRAGDYDELPVAYKDIDAVIEAQRDLVKPIYRLTPLAVVKG